MRMSLVAPPACIHIFVAAKFHPWLSHGSSGAQCLRSQMTIVAKCEPLIVAFFHPHRFYELLHHVGVYLPSCFSFRHIRTRLLWRLTERGLNGKPALLHATSTLFERRLEWCPLRFACFSLSLPETPCFSSITWVHTPKQKKVVGEEAVNLATEGKGGGLNINIRDKRRSALGTCSLPYGEGNVACCTLALQTFPSFSHLERNTFFTVISCVRLQTNYIPYPTGVLPKRATG